jgi:protein TonB
MFGVLIESRARRQRRTGGAVLSAASHLAIVGAVTAFSVRGPARPAPPEKPIVVRVVYPNDPPRPRIPTPSRSTGSTSTIAAPAIRVIEVPVVTPVGLPSIQPAITAPSDTVIFGPPGGKSPRIGGDPAGEPQGDGSSGEWRGNELAMRIVEQSKPRYPEMLRQAGVDGSVLIRFTVDTLGRVDAKSVIVLQATHELFANSARAALAGFRFRPAEVNGRRVPALAEMPFEFKVK